MIALPRQNKNVWAVLVKLAKFSSVGASGVLVNTGMLVLFYQIAGLPLIAASVLATDCAIVSNYLLNERWTFGAQSISFRRFLKFNVSSLGGLMITTGTLYLLVTGWRVHHLIANLVGIGLATGWNFTASMVWTWKKSERNDG